MEEPIRMNKNAVTFAQPSLFSLSSFKPKIFSSRTVTLLAVVSVITGCASSGNNTKTGAAQPMFVVNAYGEATASQATTGNPTRTQKANSSAPAPLKSNGAELIPIAELDIAIDPVPRPIDPLRPEVQVNLNDATAQMDLWARVRRNYKMADLNTDLVRNQEDFYRSRPEYMLRMAERSSLYLFHIVEEVERRGMPAELALLPFIESAFNPQALSTAKASGIWQFMPATGKSFNLKQNLFRDDRRSVLGSTRAALDYLQRLHGMFGDWHLALAAYNWGEGNVQRAITRNQKAGLPTDYLSLRMPNETQYYVPKLQAIKNIVARPELYGINLPQITNHPYFLSIPLQRDIDVSVAAKLGGISILEFKKLNPQMNKPVIVAAATPEILLPYDNANQFVRNLSTYQGQIATWTAWVAPKTINPSEAARMLGITESHLREINRIPPRMLVKAGSTLLVPRTAHKLVDVSETIADGAMLALAPDFPPLRKITHKVRNKETVASIAQRYRLSSSQVAQWNNLPSAQSMFRPGQTLVIYVPSGRTLAMRAVGSSEQRMNRGKPIKMAVYSNRPVMKSAFVRSYRVAGASSIKPSSLRSPNKTKAISSSKKRNQSVRVAKN
jgi:membrane-bound lytic murein transglycosylase D